MNWIETHHLGEVCGIVLSLMTVLLSMSLSKKRKAGQEPRMSGWQIAMVATVSVVVLFVVCNTKF